VTVEPRVEELLASIRKAIDEDTSDEVAAEPRSVSAGSTAMNEQGKLMRGSMREMHVSVEPAPVRAPRSADTEIEDIRAKVDRNFQEAMAPKPAPIPARTDGDFSGIMSGSRRERAPDPYDNYAPRLRSSLDYEDAPPPPRRYREREEYAPAPADPAWDYRAPRPSALMSPRPAQSAHASFEHLAESIMHRIGGDRTIEDITRDLLRGMLRQWLDDNLPPLVERLVREEIERVARRGR
jgi:uncharacterized protein